MTHLEQSRPHWDEYFLNVAQAVAARADCSRSQVGAVIVDNHHHIISTGYNGSPPGGASCLKGECPRAHAGVDPGSSYDTGPGACIALHAEQNAIIYAGATPCRNATLYVTRPPCDGCTRLIRGVGISQIIWPDQG